MAAPFAPSYRAFWLLLLAVLPARLARAESAADPCDDPAFRKKMAAGDYGRWQDYFSLVLDEKTLPLDKPERRAHVDSELRRGLACFILRMEALFGSKVVEARLKDLARNSPTGDGRIRVDFVSRHSPLSGKGLHPHNVNAGVPYPRIFMSEAPPYFGWAPEDDPEGLRRIMGHEFAHAFLGKVGDLFAEPLANLFLPSPQVDPGAVDPKELQTLAVLELLEETTEGFPREVSYPALLSYRPTPLRAVCRYYNSLRRGSGPRSARRAALDLIRTTENFGRDKATPNENRGPIRALLAGMGETLTGHILETEGVRAYLEFYYAPTNATVKKRFKKASSVTGLEAAFKTRLRRKYRAQTRAKDGAPLPDWSRYKNELKGFKCLRRENWFTQECENPMLRPPRWRPPDADSQPPKNPPAARLPPAVLEALADGSLKGYDPGAALGRDSDFDRYCAAGRP